jgi:MFS-type transporter involved in bile tolerance (Atg22 family)
MLLFLLAVISCAIILQADVIQTAIISQLASFVVAGYFFGFSWYFLFRECPPNSYLPQGEDNLLLYGFKKNMLTMKSINNTEFAPLKWFYLSIALSEAAASAFPLIATTFMTTFLKMSSNQIGLAYLIVLLGGVPGSKIGQIISNRSNAVKSAQLCLVVFSITTGLAAILLRGPTDSFKIMYLCVFWGISLGWLHPTHITILCTIIPSSQTTELMGLYIFASQILSWLPPLFFTALNESGFSMSSGLVSLNFFFAVAMLFLFKLDLVVKRETLGDDNELSNNETSTSREENTRGGTVQLESTNSSHPGVVLC